MSYTTALSQCCQTITEQTPQNIPYCCYPIQSLIISTVRCRYLFLESLVAMIEVVRSRT